jgi:hypothetical protein
MHARFPYGPEGWHAAVAGYAASFALAMIATPAVFRQPAFAPIARIGLPPLAWAALLLGYAASGAACLLFGNSGNLAAWGVCGILLWGALGFYMVSGGLLAGILSPAGLFESYLAIGCFVSVLQSAGVPR